MEKQDLKEVVLSNLRALAQSSKGGVPLYSLERDYRTLIGSSIPFKELKYPTLEAFIRDIPDVIAITKKNGELIAEGVADRNTAHIASLVSRQKQAKPTKKPRKPHTPYIRRGGFSSRYSVTRGGRSSYSPNYSSSHHVSKNKPPQHTEYSKPAYRPPPSHVQPAASKSSAPKAPSKLYVPPNQRQYQLPPRFQKKMQQNQNRSPSPPVADKQPERSYSPVSSTSKPSLEEDYDIPLMVQPRPLHSSNTARDDLLKQLDSASTAVEYIDIYGRLNNTSPEYTVMKSGQTRKTRTYKCKLQVGSIKSLSHPDEAHSEAEAKEIAAKHAVEEIKKIKEKWYNLPKTPISTPEEITILINRIEEIVCEKPSGMFERGVEKEYTNIYNEILPEVWINIVKQSYVLDVEEVSVSYGSMPSGVALIIRPSKGTSSGSTTPSETSSKAVSELQDFHSDSGNLLSPTQTTGYTFPEVPQLQLPNGNEWSVLMTTIDDNLAARIVDYNEDFITLSELMSNFYETHHLPVETVCEKQLLATTDTTNKTVIHRVCVHKIISSERIVCYYVDEGVFSEIRIADLQELHEDFLQLPYQAIHLSLDGLEEYEPFIKTEHLEFLLSKPWIALVKKCYKPLGDFLPSDPSILKMIYSVVLYNTDVPDNSEPVCLNDIVKQNVMISFESKLPKIGVSAQGYLTHITECGDVYLRFLPPIESWLEIKLRQLSTAFQEACSKGLSPPTGEVCVAMYEDGNWYRAIVSEKQTSVLSESEIEVLFIDYGHHSVIQKTKVCSLVPHSEFLASLGSQAIKCELYNALPTPDSLWTEAALIKLKEYAPFNEQLIVKAVADILPSHSMCPKVTLYKRIYSNNDSYIISINENLANQIELFTLKPIPTDDDDHLSLPLFRNGRLNLTETEMTKSFKNMNFISPPINEIRRPKTPESVKCPDANDDDSDEPLNLPQVPDAGIAWDVFITIAATPHNFVVQPLDCATAVVELQFQMNQFYSLEENLIEMDTSMLKLNGFYAALHSDGEWYRVRIVDTQMPTAYFVDFGDYSPVSIHKLQILYSRFRKLPCQAIKASLAGIQPFDVDWSPVQCVSFKDLVTEKSFVSFVKNQRISQEHGFPCVETELVLYDTSQQEDLCINDLLVKEGIAR